MRSSFLIGVVALAAVLSACGKNDEKGGARHDLVELTVKQYAFEAYPQFAARPMNADKCPTARELAEYANSANTRDPWGAELVIRCSDLPPGAVGIAVSSNGPDGKPGTADDIVSWQR